MLSIKDCLVLVSNFGSSELIQSKPKKKKTKINSLKPIWIPKWSFVIYKFETKDKN